MEVVSMAAEIYASAAGTIAQIWILSELFPRKQSVKKVYIVGWILLNFCIAHFVLLPNIWQSLLGMGVMLLMSCIMLEGRTEQKMLVIIACNVFMILVSMLRGRITFFLLYRKFLKSSEIVYNRLEIKNDITKERRGLRHDVVYEVFCFGLG